MASAICLKCGSGKHGPLAPCGRCGFVPAEMHDRVKSVLLSDRAMTAWELEAAATRIGNKEVLLFAPGDVARVSAELRWADRERVSRRRAAIRVAVVAFVVAAACALAAWWRGRRLMWPDRRGRSRRT